MGKEIRIKEIELKQIVEKKVDTKEKTVTKYTANFSTDLDTISWTRDTPFSELIPGERYDIVIKTEQQKLVVKEEETAEADHEKDEAIQKLEAEDDI